MAQQGVTPILHYDPITRVVRVRTRTAPKFRAEYTPWLTRLFDENDTVTGSAWEASGSGCRPPTRPQGRRADSRHAHTPAESHHDPLGPRSYRSRTTAPRGAAEPA